MDFSSLTRAIAALDATKVNLSASLSAWKFWLTAAGLLVFVGVAVEIVPPVVEFVRDRRTAPHELRRLLIALMISCVGGVLVAIGVGVEWYVGAKVSDVQRQIREADEKEESLLLATATAEEKALESTRNDTAKALREAGELGVTFNGLHDFVTNKEHLADEQRAAFERFAKSEEGKNNAVLNQLNVDRTHLEKVRDDAATSLSASQKISSDLNSELIQERMLRERYAQLVIPRQIDDAHFGKLVTVLKKFPKTKIDFAMSRDPECMDLLVRITDAVKASGWTIQAYAGGGLPLVISSRPDLPAIGEMTGRLVQISLSSSDLKTLIDPGNALVAGLRDAGIPINAFHVDDKLPDGKPNPAALKVGAIHVVVGERY